MYGINAVISIEEDLKTCQIGMCSAAVWYVLETAHVRSNTAWLFYDQSMEALSSQLSTVTHNEDNVILQIPALMCKKLSALYVQRILVLGQKKKEDILKPSHHDVFPFMYKSYKFGKNKEASN